MKPKIHIAVDMGGTKVLLGGVLEDLDQESGAKVLFTRRIECRDFGLPIDKGSSERKADFLKKIVDEIVACLRESESKGYEPSRLIGFGSPGLHINGVIQEGTTEQLGSAFYGAAISDELNSLLSKKIKGFQICVKNDALAQAAVGIQNVLKNFPEAKKFLGDKFCYVGPGSSLGGAFAYCRPTKEAECEIDFLDNDGHIFDILIERELAHYRLSGLFFLRKSQELWGEAKTAKEWAEMPRSEEIDSLVGSVGLALGSLMEQIHHGSFLKPEKHIQWSEAQKAEVKGTSLFILGGSIGTKGWIGEMIQSQARRYLKAKGLSELCLFPIVGESAEAALIGASSFGENNKLL